jgi:hypothetical protein
LITKLTSLVRVEVNKSFACHIAKTNASMVVEKPTCEMKVIDAKETAASTDEVREC